MKQLAMAVLIHGMHSRCLHHHTAVVNSIHGSMDGLVSEVGACITTAQLAAHKVHTCNASCCCGPCIDDASLPAGLLPSKKSVLIDNLASNTEQIPSRQCCREVGCFLCSI